MSGLDKKFSIEFWEQWWAVLKFNQILNKQDIIDILSKFPSKDREEIFSKFQNENTGSEWADKVEEYEKLQPVGFEFAPESAKEKREELKNTDNVEKMKWCQDNISYNADHTMNIISLKKTFCEDISWNKESMNFNDAENLATNKWYKLMTDYNDADADAEEIKKQSDWYKVINLFSWNKWDTTKWMGFFRDMAWCNDSYWTATKYKNKHWEELEGVVNYRKLSKYGCRRGCYGTNTNNRICGFKDSM